jgi:mannose-P-dolichol utilization defect 1
LPTWCVSTTFVHLSKSMLVKIPLIVSLANWLWKDDIEATPQQCLQSLPLLASPCWRGLLVKSLGIAMILGACFNKLPVIINMKNTKSATGLSVSSIYGETLVYTNCAAYGLLNNYPFSSWGENASLFVQTLVIVYLLWTYTDVSLNERILVLLGGLLYIVSILAFLTTQHYYLLMASVMPILLVSRGSQILETMRCGHTGAQSIITVAMSLVGGLIRILTTVQEMGWDMAVLSTYLFSAALSLMMFGQYFYYQENTRVFMAKLRAEVRKEEKLD